MKTSIGETLAAGALTACEGFGLGAMAAVGSGIAIVPVKVLGLVTIGTTVAMPVVLGAGAVAAVTSLGVWIWRNTRA